MIFCQRIVMRVIVVLSTLLLTVQVLPAIGSELPASDTAELSNSSTITDHSDTLLKRIFGDIDTLGISIGAANLKLKNPEGFDVATEVYDDGEAPSDFLSAGLPRTTLSAYSDLGVSTWSRRRFALSYDRENFEGLLLRAVSFDAGLIAQLGRQGTSIDIGASIGAGLTQSVSYRDDAIQPLLQASVHMRVSLYRVFLELVALERMHLSATLDGRSVRPQLSSTTLMLGVRFW